MDYPTTATTIGIKDLSLISSAGKNVVQSKEKLMNMSANTKRSSQLPRSKPTAADPGSKTLKSVTKQTTLRENSEASRLPSKSIGRKNTSNDEVKDSVNKTNEKNITNSKTVGGVKPIGSSKIHRNTALVKTRTPSKIASPKHPSSSSCTSNVDSPALDELKVVTELNDKFRPRSDSESSHASHSSLCSQLSTSSVKSSICLPSADRSGLAKTKKTLTSSCSRLAVSRAETKMKKQPTTLSRTASSTTVTRTNNSALSSVGKMSSDNQTSRLQSRLGAENLQRAVSTGSLKNMNTKLSIPTGRSNLTATTNRINTQALKTKTATNSSTNISANNRALHKTGTKVPVRETSRTVSTENLSAKNTNSLGKSCENLSRKPRSLLQASCENLSSKARSNRSSALSNHVADQRSSLLQSKKPSLSRSTSSSSSSSLVQQREKSSSCVSLVKDQKHTKLNGSTSSLPTVGRSDNKLTGNTNTRTGSGPERKATGIGRIQGSRPNPVDKAPVRKSLSVTNKKVTTISNATDTVGKKTTLPRAPRNISDQKGTPTAASTTKTSFGIKTSKPLENKKGCKILEKGSSLKASHANDSNKTTLNESKEKSTDYDRHEPDIPCYKTNELSIENEEKLNENNSLIRGKVSKNFAYDDYMFITDSLSYDNLSEPDVYNGDSDRENKKRNHIRSPDKGLLKNNLSTSSLDISLHEDYVDDEGVVVNFVTNSDDAPHQQEQEDFPLGQHSKQPFPASYSTSCEKGVHERGGVDLISELSNHDDVIQADNSFDSSLDVSYKSKTLTSAYLYQHHHHHHQQQQHPNKQHPLSPHHYYQHGDSKESWSGPEDEDEEDEEESDGKQGVLPGEGKGNICGGPETDTNSANDRRCVLPGKIKRGEEMGVEDKEEEEEENEEGKNEEQGRRGRGVQDKEEVPGVGFKKSADISKTAGPGMPMPEFRPPHISQHQHPQNITSRNDYTTTSGCNLVVGEGSTGETAVAVVTESTIETTAGTPTVAGGKAGGTKQPLGRGGGGGGGYKKEKQNYPVQKTTATAATAATTTTLTPARGGDKTGLLTQLVAARKEAVSLDLELQSRLDAVPIASSHVEGTNVCDIDPQRMADSLRVQSKQSKFGNYQTSSISPTTENSCNLTAADDDDDEEADSLSKDEELLMEGTASSDLVNRIRDPFLASGMAILGNQMLSPCSNDSSSFKDISDDVVTPLSDVQEIFDHDDQPSDDEDAVSNFGQNEEDEEESDRNLDTAGTEEDSDSGSVLIEIEDNPLPASVGNDEGEIIVEEPDYTSEERNYSDSNSSFVSDMIMGERPIVDAGEDLAEVSLDGNETQNLWLAIEAESQYDNMSTCMTLENIAESSIGEDEELFDQSPNVETDNAIGISEKFPNEKLDFFKEIPSQEFDMDSSDLTDERGVSFDDGTDMMTGKNSVEMMQNNSNTHGLPNFDGDFTNKESLLHSSVCEISKLSGSQDENIPSEIADMSVDNFKSQVPKKIFEKIGLQEGYLTDIDVNSNKDILSGKGQLSDSSSQQVDKSENISYYDISQEIIPDDSPFAVLKNDATKKSKDSSPQDFTLRQLQGTLNLRKQRILELCGQMEATPNKNQKPPPSPTRSTEKTGRPTRFRSTDTLNTSPQSSSLSPSPTRHERSASISIPNSEMMQSSCSSSDGQSSPMKESWIKHEGKWKRGYVLDDGKCIPAEDYTEYPIKSPNSEIIHNSLEEYENQGTSDIEEASQLSEISAADTVVDRVGELDHYLAYDESPVPITQKFQKGTETLLNTNELVSKSCTVENMAEEPVKEVTQAQETSEYEPVKEVTQVQGTLKCEKAEVAKLQESPDHEPVKKVTQAQETLRDEPVKKVAQIQEIPNKDVTLALESLPSDKISNKKYDSVDGNLHNRTVGNDSTGKKYTNVPDSVRVAQEPSSIDHSVSIVPLELPLTPSKGTGPSEQKSFSPEIVDDIPFVDVEYSENGACPSNPGPQEPYSPEIKDVKSVSGEEKTVLKKSMEVPCQENSSNLKPFSGSVTAATRPTDLDIRSSIELSVEPLSSPNSVTQVDLDGLPPVDLDQVLLNDSADVSSVDLEDEPSVEPGSNSAHLNKVLTKDEQPIGQTEELNKLSHSEDIKTEKSGKIPEELDKDPTPKTDEPSKKMESLKLKDLETISDKCLPKSDTSSQELCGENPKESFTGNEEKNHRFPEDTEILHHELDNEQPEECDTPPAGYVINSFDGSGSRTPVNKQSLTPVGSVNLLLNKSDFGRSSLMRKDSKSQKLMRPQNFESEIQTNGKQDRREALKTREEAGETKRKELSTLQAESELCKSDQDLTHVGSLCDEIFSIIGSPTLLYESWKTISSESSYEDASDMSSSQIESDDGRYSSRFSGSSSIYRNQGGSRSIYANIIRSSIHENSDSESSDCQDSCMSKSAQDYENLKRTKEKANNKLKGRGYWSDENSPDSLLASMDLYSDASEFAHACWSDRSTFSDAVYLSSPYKYRNDSSAFMKGAYPMKPEESHDIKLLAEISELDETFGESSHGDCTPGNKICNPSLRSSLNVSDGYWSPVSSPPTRKPYRRSLSLPFATRDGEGGRAALLKSDSEAPVNAAALGSPPDLPSKVGRSQRKHNTVRRFSTQQSLGFDSNRERCLTLSPEHHGCRRASEDLFPLHHSNGFDANREDASSGAGTDYKTVKKLTDRPASLDEIQLRAQFLDLRIKGYSTTDATTDKYNCQLDPSGSDHHQDSFFNDPESGTMIQPGDDVIFLPPKSPGILRRMFRRGKSFSEKVKPLRPDEVMGPPKDSFVRKMSMKAIFRRSRSGSNSSLKGKEFDGLSSDGRVESEVNHRLSREMPEKDDNLSVPSTPLSDEGCRLSNYSSVSMISSTGSTPPTSPAGHSVTFAAEGLAKDEVFEVEDNLSLSHDKNYKVLSLQLLRKSGKHPQHVLRGVPGGRGTNESETYGAGSSGSNGTGAYFGVSDVHSNSRPTAAVSPQDMEKLSAIVRGEMVSSNSSDSGIQHDSSLQSSHESLKVVPEISSGVVHRKTSVSCRERPKSDINVRWAQLVEQVSTFPEPRRRLRESSESSAPKPRPKSDLGGSTLASEAMKELLIQGKLLHSQSQKTISEMSNSAYYMSKVRRMSTPHPIKTRHTDRTAPTKLKKTLGRSFSMPENLNKIHKRRRLHPSGSDPLSDLHSHSTNDESSDESEVSMDYSLPDKCHSTRTSQLGLAPVDELFETENLTYAEALWDHVTMDPDELAFRAGDVIKVTDMLDKDWWWGILDDKEGWFPANFVRLRANQDHHLQDAQKTEGSDPNKDSSPIVGKPHQYSVSNEQARTNVINEIITAEREYVRQLDDVLEGYVVQAKKRPDMFPEDKTATIFGNLEDIYTFSKKFLKSIEVSLKDELHQSEIGHCFIEHKKGFEIYSDYCNNHPHACDQLKELCKNKRYRHFFEGCRLLQEMKQIPLEGFLLTPVQKICKYPLQLAELLKYTSTEHRDYRDVCQALDAMKKIACLINERKRRMESIEKIAQWQATVEDWEGPDLLETSSELIYSGELSKVNSSGWTQERYFFLFDHQLIYCRKDLLKKNSFSFRGRIYLDHSKISQVADGRDPQFNVYVKNGWKLHDDKRNKSFLVFSKNAVEKDRWLKAFDEERRKVKSDQENGFTIPANLRKSCVRNSFRKTQPDKPKEKLLKKNASMSFRYQQELWKNLPAHATLPRGITNPTTIIEGPPHPSGNKKRSWFSFTGKKSKR